MTCPRCAHCNEPSALNCAACGAVQAALPPGTQLALRYRVERALTRDQASITYLAFDEVRQEALMLREYLPPRVRRVGTLVVPEEHKSFARERAHVQQVAQAWRDGGHESRQRVVDVFEQHGTVYAALDAHSGVPLARRLSTQALEPAEALALTRALGAALAFTHARGQVDGALVPNRVLVRDGAFTLTPPWPGYPVPELFQAPEVIEGRPVTPAADVYALGALVLFALTRRPPPTAMGRALGEALPDLPANTPDELKRAVSQALALRVDERPQDAAALLALLASAAPVAVTPTVQTVRAHSNPVVGLAVNLQGEVVTIGADLRACRWSAALELLEVLQLTRGRPTAVQAAHERFVLSDSGGGVTVWGRTTHTAAAPEGIKGLAVLPGGTQALAWTATNALALWDLAAPRWQGQTPPLSHWITSLAASAERAGAYVGTADGGLSWLDARSGHLERLATLDGTPEALAALPNNTVLVAYGSTLQLLNGPRWSLPEPATVLAACREGRTLIAATAGGELFALTAAGLRSAGRVSARPTALAVSPSGTHVLVGTDTGLVCLLPYEPGRA